MTTYESIPELIKLNGIINWKIRKSKSDINSILFCSDKDKSIDANIEDMNKIFLVDFGNFYILDGTRSEAKNASTGRFYYEFTNLKPSEPAPPTTTPSQTTYVGSSGNGISQEELDRRIELATREIESKYKEKSLAEQKKDFDEERKEFYRDRDSALNVILTKIGAILPSIFGGQQVTPSIAVQGIAGTPEEERDVVIEPQEGVEEDSEGESNNNDVVVEDKYIDAVRRWIQKDSEGGEILVKLVDIAYNNESLYNMAKNFLKGQGYV